ncbi:MAG: nucleotidyltransferase domain-containing protein [Dehalococcoidia bacterium]
MDARTALVADSITRALRQFEAVRAVLLFGSRARGDNRDRSDIDIAIDATGASAIEWAEILESLDAVPTLLQIDVVRLETASTAMRSEIERDGLVLYDVRTRAA